MKPVRRGRLSGGDWKELYEKLKMSAEEAASMVRDGDVIASSGAANWPHLTEAAVTARLRESGSQVEWNSLFAPLDTQILKQENRDLVFFAGDRTLVPQGNVHYTPLNLSHTACWLESRQPRVAIIGVSVPDENGWMSRSLWAPHVPRPVFEQCEVLIVEVNDQLPYCATGGEHHMSIHVSEVDAIVENHHAPAANAPVAATKEDQLIAGHIADMVPDGACMQFGLGGLANAVGDCLAYAGKKDLGIHTEVISSCVAELMKKGIVNNSKKALFPGKSVGSFLVGDRDLWDYAHFNREFLFKEVAWINHPNNIARNDKVVSVNNAMEVDLTGQVNAESVGRKMYSGTGGQLEWVIGSQWSNGGKSIIALRSSYVDKSGVRHSKIKPCLPLGSAVTTPRTFVQYVVTEYGVADLRYKSNRERAKALIAIAHPDFREELTREMPL